MVAAPRRATYLFLIQKPSASARREAHRRLRELGLTVPVQHGTTALEVLATPDEAKAAFGLGLFSASLKSSMKKAHFERLTPEQAETVGRWNLRFARSRRLAVKDRSHEGTSWGDPTMLAPAPYTAIHPEVFRDVLARFQLRPKAGPRKRAAGARAKPQLPGAMRRPAFEAFERRLDKKYADPKLAYHLSRLALGLAPEYREVMLRLPPEAVRALAALVRSGREEAR